ncbi:hypothetical protein [Streptomyces sp. NRRL S-1521]|uniref:hypothetical protein n=1 Tax=Streptomyces sp. NRRL S-1521 TaxID=1609100 RepID=UPI000747395E|nr:hypothetical protein [Streptomyces sp. NRRL S-1521]KUL58636.1 hypothetical protein ADL30_10800 [Streptomyces sp. NRRL S-1521]
MSYTHKRATAHRRVAPRRVVAPALLAATALVTAALAGCSGDGSSNASSEKDPTSSAFDRALDYSKCMRSNGVPDFPDPEEDSGGVKLTPEGGADPNSDGFKKAVEACKDKAPQGLGGGGGGGGGGQELDSAKVTAWAKCLRENGVPKFPDPDINGSSMNIDLVGAGVDPQDAKFTEAMQTCQSKYPGGGVMFGPAGGGQ